MFEFEIILNFIDLNFIKFLLANFGKKCNFLIQKIEIETKQFNFLRKTEKLCFFNYFFFFLGVTNLFYVSL